MIKTSKRKNKFDWLIPATIITISVIGLSVAIYAYFQNREPELVIVEVEEEPIVLSKLDRLILGARKDALAMPAYVNAYYAGGYPPENEGTMLAARQSYFLLKECAFIRTTPALFLDPGLFPAQRPFAVQGQLAVSLRQAHGTDADR